MRRVYLIGFLFIITFIALGQKEDSTNLEIQNSAQRLMVNNNRLTIGGYGEVHYNQPLNSDTKYNGTLDVHRVVMLFGYKFNDRTQFITELEFEHVKEVYIEQAFIQYKINKSINFRAGLLLVPMGIINEYHEPTTFNGVERPLVDKYIAPTTWREIGLGISGNFLPATIRYQLYIINGFNGFDGSAHLSGANGFRKGRQKGAESYISSLNVTGKLEYYGIRGLNFGLSGYFGKTQSKLYNGIEKKNAEAISIADSSVVRISMIGLDARYSLKGLQLRGQLYYTTVSNTLAYNYFTSEDGKMNNLGNAMMGYYVEAGYNVLRWTEKCKSELIPFVRYEYYNTHQSVEEGIVKNKAYANTIITTGLTWKISNGAVLKADLQYVKSDLDSKFKTIFNAGFGVMF